MSFITINAEFRELVKVLNRIREILERAFPERPMSARTKPAGPEALTEFNPEDEWRREQEEEARSIGQTPERL